MSEYWIVKTGTQRDFFIDFVREELAAGRERSYEIRRETRTVKQNRAMYAVLTRISVALNDAGHEIPHPYEDDFMIPWSKESVKFLLFNPIMTSMFEVSSSSELTRANLSEAISVLLRFIDTKLGVYIAGMEGQLDAEMEVPF